MRSRCSIAIEMGPQKRGDHRPKGGKIATIAGYGPHGRWSGAVPKTPRDLVFRPGVYRPIEGEGASGLSPKQMRDDGVVRPMRGASARTAWRKVALDKARAIWGPKCTMPRTKRTAKPKKSTRSAKARVKADKAKPQPKIVPVSFEMSEAEKTLLAEQREMRIYHREGWN